MEGVLTSLHPKGYRWIQQLFFKKTYNLRMSFVLMLQSHKGKTDFKNVITSDDRPMKTQKKYILQQCHLN